MISDPKNATKQEHERMVSIAKMNILVALFKGISYSYWRSCRKNFSRSDDGWRVEWSKRLSFDFRLIVDGYNDFDYPTLILGFVWGTFYLTIPIRHKTKDFYANDRSYGFYWYGHEGISSAAFVVCFGRWSKHIHMPWNLDWYRTSHLLADGTWAHELKGGPRRGWGDERKAFEESLAYIQAPYTYVLKNGTVQLRSARVTTVEREWRRRWLMWSQSFNYVRRTIDVEFDDEVGERTGSWKGGTTGCGYDLLPGERMIDCLRRMERERKF